MKYVILILLIVSQLNCTSDKGSVNANAKNISFAISCGSGCAMRYDLENITETQDSLVLNFEVNMFIDERLNDCYNETFVIFNQENVVVKRGQNILSKDTHGKLYEQLIDIYINP